MDLNKIVEEALKTGKPFSTGIKEGNTPPERTEINKRIKEKYSVNPKEKQEFMQILKNKIAKNSQNIKKEEELLSNFTKLMGRVNSIDDVEALEQSINQLIDYLRTVVNNYNDQDSLSKGGASIKKPIVRSNDNIKPKTVIKQQTISIPTIYIRSLTDSIKDYHRKDISERIESGSEISSKAKDKTSNFAKKAREGYKLDDKKDPEDLMIRLQKAADRRDLASFLGAPKFGEVEKREYKYEDKDFTVYSTKISAQAQPSQYLLTHEITEHDNKWVKVHYTIGEYADTEYSLKSDPEKFQQRLLIMQFIAEQAVKTNKLLSDESNSTNVPSFFITAEGDNIDDRIISAYFLMFHQCVIPVFGDVGTKEFQDRLRELEDKKAKHKLENNEELILHFAQLVSKHKYEMGGDTKFDEKAKPATIKGCIESNKKLIQEVYKTIIDTDQSIDKDHKEIIEDRINKHTLVANEHIKDEPKLTQTYDGITAFIDIPGKTIEAGEVAIPSGNKVEISKPRRFF